MNPFKPAVQGKELDRPYPVVGDLFGTLYIAVTTLIMMYSGLFGVYPILLFYAIWLPRVLLKGWFILRPGRDILPLMLYGGFCLMSVLWSEYRSITLRAALELLSMFACIVIINRTVSTEALIKGLIIGSVLSIVPVFMSGGFTVGGLLGSKNEAGFVAEVGLLATVTYAFTKTHRIRRMLFCAIPFAVNGYCLFASRSAGSVASLAAVMLAVMTVYALSRLPRSWRKFCLMITGVLALAFLVVGYSLHLQDVVFESLGKSSNLTGRTYLWAEGIRNGLQHPILGHGYAAFWVVGRPEAEYYWYKFYIFEKQGFHFHDVYIQCFVDLGLVGLTLLGMITLLNFFRSVRLIIRNGADLRLMFCLCMSVMFLIRGIVEVDFLQAFGLGTMLFFSILPRLGATAQAEIPAPAKGAAPLNAPFRFPTQSALARKNPS